MFTSKTKHLLFEENFLKKNWEGNLRSVPHENLAVTRSADCNTSISKHRGFTHFLSLSEILHAPTGYHSKPIIKRASGITETTVVHSLKRPISDWHLSALQLSLSVVLINNFKSYFKNILSSSALIRRGINNSIFSPQPVSQATDSDKDRVIQCLLNFEKDRERKFCALRQERDVFRRCSRAEWLGKVDSCWLLPSTHTTCSFAWLLLSVSRLEAVDLKAILKDKTVKEMTCDRRRGELQRLCYNICGCAPRVWKRR